MSSGFVLEIMSFHGIHLVQVEAVLVSLCSKLSLVTEQISSPWVKEMTICRRNKATSDCCKLDFFLRTIGEGTIFYMQQL